ncbi:hypothetical protein M979_1649 [Buttiauxella noackiae ATCC 51607]|uniref:HNH nuclease domain-containing protein n=1 Tax=Buttiauxella noackiae ATCC 51607 TaxID=1354255 RepID=A0A1B7HT83_9ENTR|nr:HNH endonuclease signature motif containing protein [Buttiauxella noackiae]OAT18825.1 hypothetical protein M979_1649 [Buttiauxella noackiae ATCC 51607]
MQQAWSFKTIKHDDLRYHGNDGYDDDYSKHYRYNNFVANHKNVKVGDVVIITDRNAVLGVSLITQLTTRGVEKSSNKCPYPECNAKKLLIRKTLQPKWRCSNNHTFDSPLIISGPATEFTAEYGDNYRQVNSINMAQLKEKTLRYNVQSSIQEVDLNWVSSVFGLASFLGPTINIHDADEDVERSSSDERKIVERSIKQRRGQRSFRNCLITKNAKCAITGCELVDILEAAHIDAYRNDSHNNVRNGILLRSDIHTLFDLNLMAIHPHHLTIHFSKLVKEKYYLEFEGKKISINHSLSIEALKDRWTLFDACF